MLTGGLANGYLASETKPATFAVSPKMVLNGTPHSTTKVFSITGNSQTKTLKNPVPTGWVHLVRFRDEQLPGILLQKVQSFIQQ
jgi:hypothetical protein